MSGGVPLQEQGSRQTGRRGPGHTHSTGRQRSSAGGFGRADIRCCYCCCLQALIEVRTCGPTQFGLKFDCMDSCEKTPQMR